ECFAGRPVATSTLIQLSLKAGELSSQDFYNVTVYHVIKVVQAHKIGQLFIYDDLVNPDTVSQSWRGDGREDAPCGISRSCHECETAALPPQSSRVGLAASSSQTSCWRGHIRDCQCA